MPQFLISSKDVDNDRVSVRDKESYNHIAKSLRIKRGEKLLLIDENSTQYETVVDEITNKEIKAIVKKSYKSERKLDFKLFLAQSPLRSDAQNFIVEKTTELGVEGIIPVLTDNCALNKSIIEKKIPKWQRIMFEAFKQCERADIPKCSDVMNLEAILDMSKDCKVVAFCERLSSETLHEYCEKNPINKNDKIVVIIGPEGGFSEKEFNLFKEKSIPMLSLGNLILKAETAVVVALGNLIYEYENYRKN